MDDIPVLTRVSTVIYLEILLVLGCHYFLTFFCLKVQFFDHMNVSNVAAGDEHSLCLGDMGLFSFGRGDNGQLGVDVGNPPLPWFRTSQPRQVILPDVPDADIRIRSIAAGEHHSMAVTAAGDLYTWGLGAGGRLGLGVHETRNRNSYLPAKTTASNVRQATGGAHHTVVLSRSPM
jgi:alpha-tubulin suppressor-like RCC1 family protein